MPYKRSLAVAIFALMTLVLAAWAVPSLSQPATRGYSRLLGRHSAPPPSAVTDCRMAAIVLRAACPEAAIPDAAFEALLGQCRQAARNTSRIQPVGYDEGCEIGVVWERLAVAGQG
jgi:zona occludens toxin (predicted ATPase)